jgi:uncharacterized protein (TIGR00299 family) protein
MVRVAYLDCPTGLSGDMCLGALVDAGVPLSYLVEQLGRLGIAHEFQLRATDRWHNGQRAMKVDVDLAIAPGESQASTAPHDLAHAPHHPDPDHGHNPDHGHDPGQHQPHSHAPSDRPGAEGVPVGHTHGETRHLGEIEAMIQAAQLPARPTAWSLAIFRQLAQAEGAVHGIPPEQVHFHEVGATDAIVDIVGTCLGLDWLQVDQVYCSALPTGGGTVWAAHGRIPIPAPAVLKLWELRRVPIYHNGIDRELVTPTGAAIVTTLATAFGPPPAMTLERIGLGAGGRSLPIPNILRLWLGDGPPGSLEAHTRSQGTRSAIPSAEPVGLEAIAVLETQVDDLNPQAIGYVFDALFMAGALDVFTQPVGMKKSRPGILLTVICQRDRISACETLLFRETTTLGIRRSLCHRRALAREFHTVQVAGTAIQIKVARDVQGTILNAQPEYEDCVAVAQATDQPWRQVHQAAIAAWQQSPGAHTL